MNEFIGLLGLVEKPTNRRCWLLYKALECVPLDRAIDLARTADAFLTGSLAENRIDGTPFHAQPALRRPGNHEQPVNDAVGTPPHSGKPDRGNRTGLTLSAEHRERLLERLAEGAKNAELATQFDLSTRQVQGIRMGSAREIARRRDQLGKKEAQPDQPAALAASADDVVRYLRQQDDVVVPHGNGEFLVNARFPLSFAELIARANRMRTRQGKPAFESGGSQPARVAAANGHPLFRGDDQPA
jgi:hypothetical protein